MKHLFVLSGYLIGALALFGIGNAVQAQDVGAYTINYIEVAHTAKTEAIAALRALATESRKTNGNLRFEILQRRDRSNQFAIVEAWKDKAAHEAYLSSEPLKAYHMKLDPLQITGYDMRPHVGVSAGPLTAGVGAGGEAIYAVTHVDVVPPKKDEALDALKLLASASRAESANVRFEVLQQGNRPNHTTLVEIWKNEKALETHEMSDHTKAFRNLLTTMSGALYDQRLYSPLN